MSDGERCQNCGNIGRLLVTVRNPYINGQFARVSCSRMCAEIIARKGVEELERTGGKIGACSWTVSPLVTGKNPGVQIR